MIRYQNERPIGAAGVGWARFQPPAVPGRHMARAGRPEWDAAIPTARPPSVSMGPHAVPQSETAAPPAWRLPRARLQRRFGGGKRGRRVREAECRARFAVSAPSGSGQHSGQFHRGCIAVVRQHSRQCAPGSGGELAFVSVPTDGGDSRPPGQAETAGGLTGASDILHHLAGPSAESWIFVVILRPTERANAVRSGRQPSSDGGASAVEAADGVVSGIG